jgi:hypothetical protein
MKNQNSNSVRRIACGLTLTTTLAALAGTTATPAAAQGPAGISFAAAIPTAHKSLPLFRLVRTAAPASFVRDAAGGVRPMSTEGSRMVLRDAGGVMHAFVDAATGEAQIFPDFSSTGAPASEAALERVASAVFSRPDVIPKDATQARLGAATPVFSAAATHAADGSSRSAGAPRLLFTYIPAQRYADGLPVFGAGSQATVGVGNDGTIRAFVRRWQAAVPAGSVAPTMGTAQIERSIGSQLAPFLSRYGAASVDSVTPGYYDGNGKYLQPVYQFVATLGKRGSLQDHIRGYVPVGRLVEPLPVLGQTTGALPSAPRESQVKPDLYSGSISFGEYVNRDCTTGANCLDMASAYLNGFDAFPGWFGPTIARTQYYWAYSFEVLGSANSYLNAVNVAYTNPHGDWWLNTTIGNYIPTGDPWYVNQIGVGGNPGYGAASGGRLATWIIDSCEVIPSYYDLQYTTGNGNSAFTYWWPVFKGLHRALGFRTQMLLGEDTMNDDIALSMGEGANANSAFYNEVAAAGTFPTYLDTHLGLYVHYDRASIMYDARNGSESIFSVQGQSAAGTLDNVWMGN